MNFKRKSNNRHNFCCVNVCVEFEFSNTQRDTQREPSLFCVVANTCQWVLPRTLRGCKGNGFGISLCKLPDSDLTICQTTIRALPPFYCFATLFNEIQRHKDEDKNHTKASYEELLQLLPHKWKLTHPESVVSPKPLSVVEGFRQ